MSEHDVTNMRRLRDNSTSARRGYTLIELMLVLAVLVVLTSLVWPPLSRMYGHHQLKRAAEDVRAHAADARLRSVHAGRDYQFRFEPGGRNYVVVPDETSATVTSETSDSFADKLPEGLQFNAVTETGLLTESLSGESFAGLPGAHELEEVAWSPPTVFYADGAATDAAFDIVEEDGRYIRIAVRGLTGAVTASGIQRRSNR